MAINCFLSVKKRVQYPAGGKRKEEYIRYQYLLTMHHGTQVIVLLDEYDSPIHVVYYGTDTLFLRYQPNRSRKGVYVRAKNRNEEQILQNIKAILLGHSEMLIKCI